MDELSDGEQLECVVATEDLLHSGAFDISSYLSGSEPHGRFEEPVTTAEISKRENARIPEKTRKNTVWAVNVYRAWAEYRSTRIETLQEEYPSVPLT